MLLQVLVVAKIEVLRQLRAEQRRNVARFNCLYLKV